MGPEKGRGGSPLPPTRSSGIVPSHALLRDRSLSLRPLPSPSASVPGSSFPSPTLRSRSIHASVPCDPGSPPFPIEGTTDGEPTTRSEPDHARRTASFRRGRWRCVGSVARRLAMERRGSSLSLHSGSFHGSVSAKEYPIHETQYELLEEIGQGASATAWKAICKPFEEIVAVKLVDLESGTVNLDEIQREAKTMKNVSHPNLLPLHCCFVSGMKLWMVMPYVAAGSLLHIMKWSYPEGLDEVFIATVLREVLKGLEYLHKNGMIHRDIKAGNILIDGNGQVKLADFGVSATIERTGNWGGDGSRFTFVGTPCWMAPEVMDTDIGYDFHADIWSFGITILELAHGHAPFARYPPMKVLLMTLQNPPPTLEEADNKTFSKALRELVALCLQKDPTRRPTAAKLLEHRFFRGAAKGSDYLVKYLLADLPPLAERVQMMRNKDFSQAVVEDVHGEESNPKSASGGWNFEVAAAKEDTAGQVEEAMGSMHLTDTPKAEAKTPRPAAPVESSGESPSEASRRKLLASESVGAQKTARTFKVVEADDEDDEISSVVRASHKQANLTKTMSQPAMSVPERATTPNSPAAISLVPTLQHLLVHTVQQEKLVKQLLASLDVQDTSKLVASSKNIPSLEDLDHPNPTMAAIAEVQHQVAQLMSDMQALRDRNQHLARKVNMLSSERDGTQKSKGDEEK